ncbi:MAG: glycoside hydrolase family 27 protein [Victivallaceae bacterium]|nr:glycoside hydrolase family 27 protein [Victivallaceae bacterium]
MDCVFAAANPVVPPPPMGWNSWYCHSESVSDAAIRSAARAMVERGLSAFGWNYINIDDCWQGERGGFFGAIQGNEAFPDMYDLCNYVHSLGLRIGIYSTPWISSYAGFRGGSEDAGFEKRMQLSSERRKTPGQLYGRCPEGLERGVWRTGCDWLFDRDARQWADWTIDLVKVDWKPNDIPTARRIADDLDRSGRSIQLSLSNAAPYEFAPELMQKALITRISGDIRDTWESICANGFDKGRQFCRFIRPGHYIDPDMLQIGAIGVPNRKNLQYQASALSAEEQKSHFSLWCLLSAPLLLSCDLAGMDDATFALLTNREMLAIDQDALVCVPEFQDRDNVVTEVSKKLADGRTAIGIFNRSDCEIARSVPQRGEVKELWSKAVYSSGARMVLPPHGCAVFLCGSGK